MPKTLTLLFKGGNLEKPRFFLIFAEKWRELSLNITNKRHIRSDRGMSTKRNAILAYSLKGKVVKIIMKHCRKFQLSTPTP